MRWQSCPGWITTSDNLIAMHLDDDDGPSTYLCSGTIFGRLSSLRAAMMLSNTINAILFRLSHVLNINFTSIDMGCHVLSPHVR